MQSRRHDQVKDVAGLADMYVADQRFQQNIDKHGAGLTAFLSAAIRANTQRAPK